MTASDNFDEKMKALREQALERMAQAQSKIVQDADPKIQRLLHELNVRQIELELQNEELREAQQQLERSRERYRQLYHHAPVGYIAANSAGMILQANATFSRMLERDIDGLLNKPLSKLIHADDREIFLARYRTFHKQPLNKQFEVRMLKSDGSAIHAKLEGRRIDSTQVPSTPHDLFESVLISVSDITRRKAAEQAIVRANKQWRQTFDAVSDPIAIINEKFDIVRVNQALAGHLGVTAQACIGKKCYQLLHESNTPEENCPHLQFLKTQEPQRTEIFNPKLNGHFIASISPLQTDIQGGQPWSVHVFHDISDRKRAEEERIKSRNLESIGVLAGGIAHDFNNLLTSVVGHIELAGLYVGESENAARHLDMSMQSCWRAKDLARQFLTFSEGGWPLMRPVQIKSLIEETAGVSLSAAGMDYRLELPDHLEPLSIDEMQIKLALQNVLDNAREAMPGGGTVRIKVGYQQLIMQNGNSGGSKNFLQIDISDPGNGIPSSQIDKIFDPYFTTKPMGAKKGMGLGLAVAYSIIKKHNGRIDVQSRPGEGTTVTILLPTVLKEKTSDRRAHVHVNGNSPCDCQM
jgi:PAS domain S-box-containing protein